MKKLVFIFCAFGIILNSCSNDSSGNGGDPLSGGIFLKTKIDTYDGEDLITNYIYSGNKITGIVNSDGYSEEFIYTGDLLTTVKEYEGLVLVGLSDLEYDSSNRLISETYTYDIVAGLNNVNEFTYNEDGTITKSEDNLNTYIYTYDANGNRIIKEDIAGDNDYTFTYDTKNNPFKNIYQREVFELLGHFAYSNNILTSEYSGDEAFSSTYIYNPEDYPESVTTTYEPGTANEEVETVQYIYEIRVF